LWRKQPPNFFALYPAHLLVRPLASLAVLVCRHALSRLHPANLLIADTQHGMVSRATSHHSIRARLPTCTSCHIMTRGCSCREARKAANNNNNTLLTLWRQGGWRQSTKLGCAAGIARKKPRVCFNATSSSDRPAPPRHAPSRPTLAAIEVVITIPRPLPLPLPLPLLLLLNCF